MSQFCANVYYGLLLTSTLFFAIFFHLASIWHNRTIITNTIDFYAVAEKKSESTEVS